MQTRLKILLGVGLGVAVLLSGVFVVRSLFLRDSLCSLIDAQLPAIANDENIDEVVSALRKRADALDARFDISDPKVKEALQVIANGFTRVADEVEGSDKEWKLDEVVSELAKDSQLTTANNTLEKALQQCL